ncbi:hypothetical protein EGW08_012352 [Elysia chlorotica]|uniref:Peroxiredoxin-5 n=1 Tax=Elysia chlorotica TaxID=188477 RepID=A0A433TE92_ELYCH|nr:hypothetical protein EGW08_012352 [Elysia chlorotica]
MQALRQFISRPALCYSSLFPQRFLQTSSVLEMPIKVGDPLPSVELMNCDPSNKVDISSYTGKIVIFGVPGAFTPTCSKDHAPGFVNSVDALKAKGVEKVVCVAVNDPFVMGAWRDHLDKNNQIEFLADISAEFTKAIGLDFDASPILGNVRCKRFTMVVENGKVKALNVEPDGTGLTCSRAKDVLKMV